MNCLSQGELQRLALYCEFFRPLHTKHHMAVLVSLDGGFVRILSFGREGGDFSAADCERLDLLRPHIQQAYSNAQRMSELQLRTVDLLSPSRVRGLGIVLVDHSNRVSMITDHARELFGKYFGGLPTGGRRLPDRVAAWVRRLRKRDSAGLAPVMAPLVVARGRSRLSHRLLEAGNAVVVVLEELLSSEVVVDRYRSAGLTKRESEVLYWVGEGKTDPEVGMILGISKRTVQKHMEHVFSKLSVSTRTAAVATIQQQVREVWHKESSADPFRAAGAT